MKGPGRFFLWIALLTAGLLVSITVAQIVTQQSLSRLRNGNLQATSAIMMNNRLQEMVNLAFELETKILGEKQPGQLATRTGVKDSLKRLEYNIGILEKTWPGISLSSSLDKLAGFVKVQVLISFSALKAAEEKDTRRQKLLTDSLRNNHFGDSIYSAAISFQKQLEKNLNVTTIQNSNAALQLSFLNRLLAGSALLAILVLATIIIRRQVKQLALIRDLEEARKVALQSAEAKDQFLANMSHEIRTPLNAIKGFGKILTQTRLTEDQRQYASIISAASDNLLTIVNDILDFSKIETGNLVLQLQRFSLPELVTGLELMFKPQAEEKGLLLMVKGVEKMPNIIKGDPERLRQILVNLLSNAIKFTAKGSVVLSLRCEEGQKGHYTISFSVKDTGPGIPAEKQHIIFERFEQLDHSYTREQGGTGLGLAITRKLCEAMNGKISVQSEAGKGSVFLVELPFAKIKKEENPVSNVRQVQTTGQLNLSTIKVLVAEDNRMNQLLVKSILEKYGASPEMADNGEAALAILGKEEFDLILMDLQMPKVDGITVTKRFRKESGSATPIIAMTAHVLPGEREKCLDAGMSDYLTKPLDEDELMKTISKYIGTEHVSSGQMPVIDSGGVDIHYVETICGNNKQKVQMVLDELGKQLPADTSRLQHALQGTDLSDIKRVCHHLRSTLSPFFEDSAPVKVLEEFNTLLSAGSLTEPVKEKGKKLVQALEQANRHLQAYQKMKKHLSNEE